ncbi:hypothetical protein LINPERHAP1_LOCUS24256 [Linum perenne]
MPTRSYAEVVSQPLVIRDDGRDSKLVGEVGKASLVVDDGGISVMDATVVGIDRDREFKLLGDDSWLLDCGSLKEVDKILKKEKWVFRGLEVGVKRWTHSAGRSNLVAMQGALWIIVFGIPIHLRSEALFKSIGDLCGGFLEGMDTGFSAVRLKVKKGTSLPTSILLKVQGISVEIKILLEPSFSGDKGKEMAADASEFSDSSSSDVELRRPETGECSLRKIGEAARASSTHSPLPFGPPPKPADDPILLSLADKPLGPLDMDLGHHASSVSQFLDLHFLPSGPFSEADTRSRSEPSSVCPAAPPAGCEEASPAVLEIPIQQEAVPTPPITELTMEESWETVAAKGRKLASILDLRIKDSVEEAQIRIEETTKKVFIRRSRSAPKSKQDLELHRLNWNLADSGQPSASRRPRYDSPSCDIYES